MKKANIKLVLVIGSIGAAAISVITKNEATAVVTAVYFAALMVCVHIDQKGDPQ